MRKIGLLIMMSVLFLSVGLVFLHARRASGPAASAPDLVRLPVGTRLIARVDLQKPMAAKIWKRAVARMSSSEGEGPSRLSASCAADIMMRVQSLVLSSGQTFDELGSDHAIVVRGRFEPAALERCAKEVSSRENAPQHVDGRTYYRGIGNKWLSILSSEAFVFGTLDRVKAVIAAIEGRSPVATAATLPELAEWEKAHRDRALMIGALLPDGYAAQRHADYTVLATLLDVKSVLVTADLESDDLVVRANLHARDADRAQEVRTSVEKLTRLISKRNTDVSGDAQVRGNIVEAKLALTKAQTDAFAAKLDL